METTPAHRPLQAFRQELYQALRRRADALFELADAVLTASGPLTTARLSLEPVFRRRWPSASDALSDGSLEGGGARARGGATRAGRARSGRGVWARGG